MKARHVQTMGGEWIRVYDADDVELVLGAIRKLATVDSPYVVMVPATATRADIERVQEQLGWHEIKREQPAQ